MMMTFSKKKELLTTRSSQIDEKSVENRNSLYRNGTNSFVFLYREKVSFEHQDAL